MPSGIFSGPPNREVSLFVFTIKPFRGPGVLRPPEAGRIFRVPSGRPCTCWASIGVGVVERLREDHLDEPTARGPFVASRVEEDCSRTFEPLLPACGVCMARRLEEKNVNRCGVVWQTLDFTMFVGLS